MKDLLDYLELDEITLKLSRKVDESTFQRNYYIEVIDRDITIECDEFCKGGVDFEVLEYLKNMPSINQDRYKSFIMRSTFKNYFISYTDLIDNCVKIIDTPVFKDGAVYCVETKMYHNVDEIKLSKYKYIYSFEECGNGIVKIRGVKV